MWFFLSGCFDWMKFFPHLELKPISRILFSSNVKLSNVHYIFWTILFYTSSSPSGLLSPGALPSLIEWLSPGQFEPYASNRGRVSAISVRVDFGWVEFLWVGFLCRGWSGVYFNIRANKLLVCYVLNVLFLSLNWGFKMDSETSFIVCVA